MARCHLARRHARDVLPPEEPSDLGVLVTTIFGVPSAGGVCPLAMVPGFFRVLGDWLPLRYLADGARSIVFYNRRLDAGLGTAIFALAAYAVGSIIVGGLVAEVSEHVRDRRLESAFSEARVRRAASRGHARLSGTSQPIVFLRSAARSAPGARLDVELVERWRRSSGGPQHTSQLRLIWDSGRRQD
jgi:hypothetical protein